MNDFKRDSGKRRNPPAGRKAGNTFTTKSGQTIKLNRSLGEKMHARREAFARRRAERLAGLPKSRLKRAVYLMHPKRMYKYWFSREGGLMALKVSGIGIIAGFLVLVGVFAYFRKDLPNLKDISGNNIGGSVLYYDKTGQTLLWEDVNGVKRIPVEDDKISDYIKDATIAIEDKDFFQHGGFDVRGIARASVNNAFGSNGQQGGSTITQQLVKVTQDWTRDNTYKRKVKELILSVELERSYSKKEILNGYLNAVPYGGVEYGVEAASQNYFQKSAKDLTLDEAAMLASIPKAPAYFSPYSETFERPQFIGRQHYILDLMEQQGMISAKERDEAKKVDTLAKVKPRQTYYAGIKAPYFVLLAKKELENKFGDNATVKKGGYKVTTTLDMKLQTLAEEQVAKGMPLIQRNKFDSAAFVASDVKTGHIVAVVGGSDFNNPEFGENNYAHWRLPPGSSFKPYDYISLMEHTNNFGAGSVLHDTQGPIDGYPCTNKARPKDNGNCMWNFDFRYPGPMTLRYALGGSRNVPAAKAMLIAGVDKTIQTSEKLGLDSGYKCYQQGVEDVNYATSDQEAQCYTSAAIGDGAYLYLDEHVNGYATISRNGLKYDKTYILKIEDSKGKLMDEWKPQKGEQVLRPDSAYIVADMMSDPNASYFSRGNKPQRYQDWKFSIKTGTTNDAKDGWFMGFSTQYAAGVWVGHHTRRVATNSPMENLTMPIWNGWMREVHKNLKPEERPRPSGVKTAQAFVVRNHVGFGSVEPSPSTDLFPSWYEGTTKATGKKTIDIVSNKLATDCTPPRAKRELNEADASSFTGDRFAVQNGNNTEQKDDIHQCGDIKPSVRLMVQKVGDGTYEVSADVTAGTHPLSSEQFPGTVNFIVDGQIIPGGSFNVTANGVTPKVTYNANFSGKKTMTAEVIDSVLYDNTSSAIEIEGATTSGGPTGNRNRDGDDDSGTTGNPRLPRPLSR